MRRNCFRVVLGLGNRVAGAEVPREVEFADARPLLQCGYHCIRGTGKAQSGNDGSAELRVGEEHTAPRVGSGKSARAGDAGDDHLIEAAALDAVERLLPPGYQSLATLPRCATSLPPRLACALTPKVEVTRVEGRTIFFRVRVFDEIELIGDGSHERVVVNVAKFDARVQRKLNPP